MEETPIAIQLYQAVTQDYSICLDLKTKKKSLRPM